MQHKVTHRIDRHLDEQLGLWTRLLPWRREMAVHIEEAYQAARAGSPAETPAESPEGAVDDVFWHDVSWHDISWQSALADFGDVQLVASQLRKEHWPQYVGVRIVAVVVSALIVFSMVPPRIFMNLPALCFALGPMIAFVVFDACRGSARWELARRVGAWGALCGAMLGTAGLLADMADPSNVGYCMAVSLLSALYCVLFFAPGRLIVATLVGLAVVDMGLVIISFSSAVEFALLPAYWDNVDGSFVIRVLAICGAGLCVGIARFGFHGVARHAYSIGMGIFLVSLIIMLSDMSDPRTIVAHLLVGFGAMVLAVGSSHCISDSSRFVRRILS